jgi:hypothetical protein
MIPMVFVSRGGTLSQHIQSAMRELATGSDRAVAIVGGSIVEMSLTDALKTHLHESKKITDELFRSAGAFGMFATKVHLGLLIGLYGEAAHRDLIVIKDIRNAFAHSLEITNFQTPRIKDLANNLRLCERYSIDQQGIETEAGRNEGSLPKDWRWWCSVPNLEKNLQMPRERYIIAAQVLTYGLMIPGGPNMPCPRF